MPDDRWIAALVAAILTLTLAGGCRPRPDTTTRRHTSGQNYAELRHPFHNARLYLDHDTAAARWQTAHAARWLDPITSSPQTHWLNDPQSLDDLPTLTADAAEQHALPVLVAYYIPHRDCGTFTEGAPNDAAYDQWIGQLITGLRSTPRRDHHGTRRHARRML